jgi:predicted Rossmann fold flavoprotein
MSKSEQVIIIGGGPAGMMAGISAARNRADVILLEKNNQLGQKLLMTGKGRCNLTTTKSKREIIEAFDKTCNGRFLWNSLAAFSNEDAMRFFEDLGVGLKEERGQRVFPESDKARTVLDALQSGLQQHSVRIRTNTDVTSVEKKGTGFLITTPDAGFKTGSLIIATGGLSYPETGSTGDGYYFAQELNHTVNTLKPALVGLEVPHEEIHRLQGLTLKNVTFRLFRESELLAEEFGELLFTHYGISGPTVLEASRFIDEEEGRLLGEIDLKPALSTNQLDNRILREVKKSPKQLFKNILKNLLPSAMIHITSDWTGILENQQAGQVTSNQRGELVHFLKHLRFGVACSRPIEEAVVTAGGVALSEVDPQTMESLLVQGLYFAGEILDLDGPTGGFNLQMCWTTGYVAGKNAAE